MMTRKRAASDTATRQKRRVRVSTEPLTPEEHAQAQETFLAEYAKRGNVTVACNKAGIHRATFYRWQEHDATFSLRHQQVKEEYCDSLRQEITRRARDGVLKPVYQGGVKVGTIREYSDTLLIFEAKRHMPEYRDKIQLEQSGQVTVSHDFGDDPTTAAIARDLLSRLSSGAGNSGGAGMAGEQ